MDEYEYRANTRMIEPIVAQLKRIADSLEKIVEWGEKPAREIYGPAVDIDNDPRP